MRAKLMQIGLQRHEGPTHKGRPVETGFLLVVTSFFHLTLGHVLTGFECLVHRLLTG
jgi:hypothetical protein